MVALYLRLASNKTHIRFLYGVGAIILGHGITATFVRSCRLVQMNIKDLLTGPGCILHLRTHIRSVEPRVSSRMP
jgi:hypothetical protein